MKWRQALSGSGLMQMEANVFSERFCLQAKLQRGLSNIDRAANNALDFGIHHPIAITSKVHHSMKRSTLAPVKRNMCNIASRVQSVGLNCICKSVTLA